MRKNKNVAVILAGGIGKRMNSDIPKQFLMLGDKPVLFYSLNAFEQSYIIDEVILVVSKDYLNFCQFEIIRKYSLKKVVAYAFSGKERYESVYNGLLKVENADYIFIHDGARPFVSEKIIERTYEGAVKCGACIAGVCSKDTVKISNSKGYVVSTPVRDNVWLIQTPQVFRKDLICDAYDRWIASGRTDATDDAMVVEKMLNQSVMIMEGSYQNIKITTPEDLKTGELYL